MKKLLSVVFSLAFILSIFTISASAASLNIYKYEYIDTNSYAAWYNWGQSKTSYLAKISGGYLRLDYDSEGNYCATTLDEKYNVIKTKTYSAELVYFGGFCSDEEYFYVLSGQPNYEENSKTECFRITQYKINGGRVGSIGFRDCNTVEPFSCGNGKMVIENGILYIHTSHEMYAMEGINHEANISFKINVSDFVQGGKKVISLSGSNYFMIQAFCYSSHSFNQFLVVKDGIVYTADHGDAYPRGIGLGVANAISNANYSTLAKTTIKEIPGAIGDNETKMNLGGFAVTKSGVLTVGKSVDMKKYDKQEAKNVFITYTELTNDDGSYLYGTTTERYLTSVSNENNEPSNPFIVDLENDTYLVIWEYEGKVYYQKVNSKGKSIGSRKSETAYLSSCQPILVDGKVVWYKHTNPDSSNYYEIDIDTMDLKTVTRKYTEKTENITDATKKSKTLIESDSLVVSREFESGSIIRTYGDTRYQTSIKTADALKKALGVSKFDTIIVAYGRNFADALAGSYLAAVKSAPILVVNTDKKNANDKSSMALVRKYINNNLSNNGTVYVLGGEAVISKDYMTSLKASGRTVTRLYGENRYETNIAILKEAGFKGGDLLISDAYGYADALSASSLGKPILLVDKASGELSATQVVYLKSIKNKVNNTYFIGGTSAVPSSIESSVKVILDGNFIRFNGENRYETSAIIANYFFDMPKAVVLAYGHNFPDGLCGGPLAYALGSPLLLTYPSDENSAYAKSYVKKNSSIKYAMVLGGQGSKENPQLTDSLIKSIKSGNIVENKY